MGQTYDPVKSKTEPVQFICYGNADTAFAFNSLQKIHKSLYAQAALSMIITSMIDYSEHVRMYFGLNKPIGLLKVAQYYAGDDLVQSHNALDDAKMLKFVYDNIQQGEELAENPFPEYMQRVEQYDLEGNLVNTFYGLSPAADYILSSQKMPEGTVKRRVRNKIVNAAEQKKSYCGFNWVILN